MNAYQRWVPPNFDNRSFRLNFEVITLIFDKDFNQQMEDMFIDDFANSVEVKPDLLENKPLR